MTENSYQQVAQSIGLRYVRSGLPMAGQIEITKRCNLDCRHCYLDHQAAGKELSQDELLDLLSQLHEMNLLHLAFTGGEPFVRKEVLFKLLEEARRLTFHTSVFSTLTLLEEDDARRMADLAVGEVHVSLYSDRPEIHEAITRQAGSYTQTRQGIDLLLAQGMKVVIKTPVMTLNRETLLSTIQLAKDLGCQYRQDLQILPAENGVRDPQSLALSGEQLQDLFANETWIREVYQSGNLDDFCREFENPDPTGTVCTIARSKLLIDAFGTVWFCPTWRSSETTREKSLKDIWWGEEAERLRGIRWEDMEQCTSCSLNSHCTPCVALSRDETGNLLACSPSRRKQIQAMLTARKKLNSGK